MLLLEKLLGWPVRLTVVSVRARRKGRNGHASPTVLDPAIKVLNYFITRNEDEVRTFSTRFSSTQLPYFVSEVCINGHLFNNIYFVVCFPHNVCVFCKGSYYRKAHKHGSINKLTWDGWRPEVARSTFRKQKGAVELPNYYSGQVTATTMATEHKM
jgi:hypothetical protein